MPQFGGFTPFPIRFGGAKPVVQTIHDGLNAARGTAYDVTSTSPVWVENLALARALADVWNTNELLANQFDPRKITILLPRWEKVLGIVPAPTDTESARRARVTAIVSRAGVAPNYQETVDRLNAVMSPVTVSIAHVTPSTSGIVVSWPGSWYVQSVGTTPPTIVASGTVTANTNFQVIIDAGGARGTATFKWSSDGGATFSASTTTAASVALGSTGITLAFAVGTYATDNQYFFTAILSGWFSSVARVTVVCTQPSYVSESQYQDRVAAARLILSDFLPAWVDFHFVRDGSVTGHFRLDEPRNLDNQRFA